MAGDSENLIENIMSMLGDNPQEKISQILGSLTSNESSLPTVTENTEGGEKNNDSFDISALLKLQSALSPGGSDDDKTRLLAAIKPFLNDKRKPQVDQILKLLKLANVAQKAGGLDILKNLNL